MTIGTSGSVSPGIRREYVRPTMRAPIARHAISRRFAYEDLAGRRFCSEAGRGVDGVAERGEVPGISLADRADVRGPRVHRRAERKRGPVFVATNYAHQLARRGDRACRVVAPGESGDKERHDLVADELVHDPVPTIDRRGGKAVEPR